MSSTYTIGMASNLDSFADAPPASATTTPPLFFYFLFVTYDAGPAPTIVISEMPAGQKATRKAAGAFARTLPAQQKALFPQAPGNPTVSIILQTRPTPGSLVRVEVTTSGTTRPPEDFDLSASVNQSQITLALRHEQPPRLSVAVNTTFVAKPPGGNFAAPKAAEIQAVLRHIHNRLLDGPTAAWRGIDGAPQLPFSTTPNASDEESWAQQLTQMLVAMPYGLPSTLYSASTTFTDEDILRKYLDDTDPGYSMGCECQHLVTMAAMTRGLDMIVTATNKAGVSHSRFVQFTAGDGSASAVTDLKGSFVPAASIASVDDAIKHKVTPGSSWVFNGFDDSGTEMANKGAAHIGFAVRVDLEGKRIQTFDTGGLNTPGRATPLNAGTFDDPWIDAAHQVPGPVPATNAVFKGVCVLPEAANLGAAVDRMRRARPLGFARLVLISRSAPTSPAAKNILYAGPLLRMHYDGPGSPVNLSYAAYLWSLREHPGASDILATWLFYTPRSALAHAMLHGTAPPNKHLPAPTTPPAPVNPRPLTIAQMVALAGITTKPDHPLNTFDQIFEVADHQSQADGTVTVARRFDQHGTAALKPSIRPAILTQLPWGKATGTVALTDADLADMPYFTSG